MRFSVRVKPRAKKESVEVTGPASLTVRVREPAQDGRANAGLCRLLAGHFKVAASEVVIVRGQASRNKIVDVFISP